MRITNQRRALVLTVAGDAAASSRVRVGPVLDRLARTGWDVRRIATGTDLWIPRFVALLLRFPQLVIIQKVPLARPLSRLAAWISHELIFELDDAIYFGYPGDADAIAHSYRKRVFRIAELSTRIVTSSAAICEDLGYFSKTVVFPGPAPSLLDSVGRKCGSLVVWVGSPSTAGYFDPLRTSLFPLLIEHGYQILLLGTETDEDLEGGVRFRRWTAEREKSVLLAGSIGLMPQSSDVWSRRKAAYKLLVYLSADIVPVYQSCDAAMALLGDEAQTLGVAVRGASAEEWCSAVVQAMSISVDEKWVTARDSVFRRLSSTSYVDRFLEPWTDGER